ncbi:GbsR/MarR family transcriptional regulator [Actinocorallia aurantiaca]|uniref:MarR family transcriptional regulator n=1 Tax=Actinocorallia aurantiaca TaxID=46204 RepID=A0ABN3ULR4_9ACTN
MTEAAEAAERLALMLSENGLQKATARVMAAFLFSETESVTASELVEQLGISSGSASGAIKMLSTVGLIERVPMPGSRREHYRLREGAWATLMSAKNGMLLAMLEAAQQGIEAVDADSPAARRLTEMRDFYTFMLREIPALLDRWHTERTAETD